MTRMRLGALAAIAAAGTVMTVPANAATARELLTQASFVDRDKSVALHHVETAQQSAAATLERSPGDREAQAMQATAIGYRAKLTGSRSDAADARKQFEAMLASDPHNADVQLGLGAWHMGAVFRLGGMMAHAVLGAQKSVGLAALDRAVALGGGRAMFAGLAGLLRLEANAKDARGRQLVEMASHAPAPTQLDRLVQAAATAELTALRSGDDRTIRETAARLLPFGTIPRLS